MSNKQLREPWPLRPYDIQRGTGGQDPSSFNRSSRVAIERSTNFTDALDQEFIIPALGAFVLGVSVEEDVRHADELSIDMPELPSMIDQMHNIFCCAAVNTIGLYMLKDRNGQFPEPGEESLAHAALGFLGEAADIDEADYSIGEMTQVLLAIFDTTTNGTEEAADEVGEAIEATGYRDYFLHIAETPNLRTKLLEGVNEYLEQHEPALKVVYDRASVASAERSFRFSQALEEATGLNSTFAALNDPELMSDMAVLAEAQDLSANSGAAVAARAYRIEASTL